MDNIGMSDDLFVRIAERTDVDTWNLLMQERVQTFANEVFEGLWEEIKFLVGFLF